MLWLQTHDKKVPNYSPLTSQDLSPTSRLSTLSTTMQRSNLEERRARRRERQGVLSSNYKDFMKMFGDGGTSPLPQLFTVTRAEYNKAWSKFKRSWNNGVLFNNGTQVCDTFAKDDFMRQVVRDCILIQRGHAKLSKSTF